MRLTVDRYVYSSMTGTENGHTTDTSSSQVIPEVRNAGFWSFCMTPTYVMLNPQCDVTGNTRMVA